MLGQRTHPPVRWKVELTVTTRRVVGAVLVFVAAGLGVAATFLDAYSVSARFGARTLRFETTAWEVTQDDLRAALLLGRLEFGEPAVVAGVVMSLAAGLAFRHPVARIGSLLGAGVLVGAAWSAVSTVQGVVERLSDSVVQVPLEVEQGDGVTLLVVAAGVAVVAAVLHQELPRRSEVVGETVIHEIEPDDTETPPYGFPVIVEPKSD